MTNIPEIILTALKTTFPNIQKEQYTIAVRTKNDCIAVLHFLQNIGLKWVDGRDMFYNPFFNISGNIYFKIFSDEKNYPNTIRYGECRTNYTIIPNIYDKYTSYWDWYYSALKDNVKHDFEAIKYLPNSKSNIGRKEAIKKYIK